jgi:hypothetical protein
MALNLMFGKLPASDLTEEELTRALTYVGLVLVAYEIIKSLIVQHIKAFYKDVTFGPGMPFRTYEEDVMFRHKDEFEACLMYLRDFMQAIDADDMDAIQRLRKHRNELAHDLVYRLDDLQIGDHAALFREVDAAIFKLSKHRAYMEFSHDLEFQNRGIDWETVKGHEYLIFEDVIGKIKMFR